MASPRNGCIVRTTYLGYLDREPTAPCSAIGSYRSIDTWRPAWSTCAEARHPGCLAQYHRKPL